MKKKILSIVLAVAMIAAIPFSAMAAKIGYGYEDDVDPEAIATYDTGKNEGAYYWHKVLQDPDVKEGTPKKLGGDKQNAWWNGNGAQASGDNYMSLVLEDGEYFYMPNVTVTATNKVNGSFYSDHGNVNNADQGGSYKVLPDSYDYKKINFAALRVKTHVKEGANATEAASKSAVLDIWVLGESRMINQAEVPVYYLNFKTGKLEGVNANATGAPLTSAVTIQSDAGFRFECEADGWLIFPFSVFVGYSEAGSRNNNDADAVAHNRDVLLGMKKGNFTMWVEKNDSWCEHLDLMWGDLLVLEDLSKFVVSRLSEGSCGEGVDYVFDAETGTLKISGTGAVATTPWDAFAAQVLHVEVASGCTGFCADAFKNCTNLVDIKLPDGCDSLPTGFLPAGVTIYGVPFTAANTFADDYSYDFVDVCADAHTYADTVVEATCEAGGYTEHVCQFCGDNYTDNETAALGHNWVAQSVVDATKASQGYTVYACTNCDATKNDNYVDYIDSGLEGTATDKSITLSWTAVSGASKYWVRVCNAEGALLRTVSSTTNGVTVNGLAADTTYNFAVCSKKGSVVSDYSIFATIATAATFDYRATVSAEAVADGVSVTWTVPVDGEKYYVYYRATGTQAWTCAGATTEKAKFIKLAPGSYDFSVVVKLAVGNYTDYAEKATATAVALSGPTGAGYTPKKNGVTATWAAVTNADKYFVQIYEGAHDSLIATKTTTTNSVDAFVKGADTDSYVKVCARINTGSGYVYTDYVTATLMK